MGSHMAKGGSTVLRETCDHVSVEWEIQNFLLTPYMNKEKIESHSFLIGDSSWCLWIYPNGSLLKNKGYISIFLHKRSSSSGVHTILFNFDLTAGGLKIVNGKDLKYAFDNKKSGWGWERYVERSRVSKVLKDASPDCAVTVVCKARLLDGKFASQTESVQSFCKTFEGLFHGGKWSDVKIKVAEREFDAHKLVLRARSSYFEAMFDHQMAESRTGVVEIHDTDPDTFKDILLFLYTGQLNHVTARNAVALYKAADKYVIAELKEECKRVMVTELSVDSVLDVILLAVTYNEDEILKNAEEFFVEKAEEIISTQKWKLFLVMNVQIANELLLKMTRYFKNNVKRVIKN